MGFAIANALVEEGHELPSSMVTTRGCEAAHRLDKTGRRVIGRKVDVTTKAGCTDSGSEKALGVDICQ
jgi:hypothetical protein